MVIDLALYNQIPAIQEGYKIVTVFFGYEIMKNEIIYHLLVFG